MKLLYCDSCGDLFNLQLRLKSCGCGKTKGLYVNYEEAEVNGSGFSIAIGNGSLNIGVAESFRMEFDPRKRSSDPWARHEGSIICWARPHTGPANPHTKINKEL